MSGFDPALQRFVAYHGLVRLVHWECSSNGGARIKLALVGREELAHFDRAAKRTKTRSGSRYTAFWCNTDGELAEGLPSELWFYAASWSATRGATVQFVVQDDDLEAFKGLQTADASDGEGAGWLLALVELGADETPIDQLQREKLEALELATPTGGPVSKSAGILGQDPSFWRFLQGRVQRGIGNEEEAAAAVRELCGVTSRAWLDHDPEARAKYEALKGEFVRWGRRYGS